MYICYIVIAISDLYVYRDEIIPLIDKIIGNRESMITIKIDRNKIFEEATGRFVGKVKQLAKISSPVHEKPVITFNDTDILDVDGSGFRREYYSVYFRKCIANLFEGQGRQMLPKKDCTKKDELKALGIAIVECVLNGDCGFPYLHRGIYKAIIGCDSDEIDPHCNLNDIPDGEVRMVVQQVSFKVFSQPYFVMVIRHVFSLLKFIIVDINTLMDLLRICICNKYQSNVHQVEYTPCIDFGMYEATSSCLLYLSSFYFKNVTRIKCFFLNHNNNYCITTSDFLPDPTIAVFISIFRVRLYNT